MNVRCDGCGAQLRYAGEPCYTCTPASWISAYQRRQRGRSQNDEFGTAVGAALLNGERRQLTRSTYRRIRAETADEQAVAQYLADRPAQAAVIARAGGRSRGRSSGEISRAAAQAYARGPGGNRCAGPGCPVCAWARSQGIRLPAVSRNAGHAPGPSRAGREAQVERLVTQGFSREAAEYACEIEIAR